MRKEKTALSGATGNAAKHDPSGVGQNRDNDSSTQPRLPGEWPADFETHGFTDRELSRAGQVWREFDELCERVPDLRERAAAIAAAEIQRVGFIGTRLLGERVRSWCIEERGLSFRNELIAALARSVARDNVVLGEYLRTRFCPLDVVPHA